MITAVFFVFAHPFLTSAFGAGTAIAVASGLVGYVVVLRGQVFAGDALSHVAFTGALAALAFGVDLRLGLYGGCVAFALLLAVLGRRSEVDDTVVGSVFAWVLGLGALFLSLFTTSSTGIGGSGGTTGVSVLFGSILGLSGSQARADAAGVGCRGRDPGGHGPPVDVHLPGSRRRAFPWGAGPCTVGRVPRPAGRDRGRGHPGRRRPPAAGLYWPHRPGPPNA